MSGGRKRNACSINNRDHLFAGWSFFLLAGWKSSLEKKPFGLFSIVQRLVFLGGKVPVACSRLCNRSFFFFQFHLVRSAWAGGYLVIPPCTPARQGPAALGTRLVRPAVDMGFSLRSSSLPMVGKALLRGFGSLLGGCAACGVFLRAMPRPAKLSRREPTGGWPRSRLSGPRRGHVKLKEQQAFGCATEKTTTLFFKNSADHRVEKQATPFRPALPHSRATMLSPRNNNNSSPFPSKNNPPETFRQRSNLFR